MIARPSRLLAAVALAGALVALVLVVLRSESSRTLRAGFDNVVQLTEGQEVRVAGRQVGEVGAVELVDGQATVELRITDEDVWPLPKGTVARTRWGSTTAYLTRYIELYPGPVGAGTLEDGAIVRARTAFELDDAYRIFRGDTDGQTRRLLDLLGGALEGQGADLRRGLDAAPPGLDATGELTRELAADEERLRTLAVAGDRTTTALAAQAGVLRELVVDAAGTIEELAEHAGAQQQSLDRAPATFERTTSTLARFDASIERLDALVADLRPGAPALRDLAGTARGALARLRTVSPLLASTLDRGTAAAPRLERLFDRTSPVLPQAAAALRTFNPMLACLRPYGPEIAGFLSTWTGQLKNYDSQGHYARSFPITVIPALLPGTPNTSKAAIDAQPGRLRYAMPRPPGLNAGQPWFQPQCGAGPESLDPAKDPEASR